VASDSTTWLALSVTRRRSQVLATPTTSPMAMPPPICTSSSSPTSPAVGEAPTAVTASANTVSAIPSLIRPSPSSTVTNRRGTPSRCRTFVAATGSGGATAAPNASAAAQPTSGKTSSSAPAQVPAVTSTNPTDWPITAGRCSTVSRGSL
jgi:hypothetical protein